MADPVTWLAIGTGISAGSSLMSASAERQAGNYNADLAQMNAEIARQNAEINAADIRRESFKTLGAARADYAGSGVQESGSALDVLAESAFRAEMDAQRAEYAGKIEGMGYQSQAALAKFQGNNRATSQILGGIGTVVSGYADMQRLKLYRGG